MCVLFKNVEQLNTEINNPLSTEKEEEEEDPVPSKARDRGQAKAKKAEKKEEVKFDYYESEEETEDKGEEEVKEEAVVEENKPKLSKKELKKLKKQAEYQKQLESMESGGVENFTVSQAERSTKATVLDSQDIKVENFSIAAKGKDLFINASLYITAGRRYGLVGPNGHGKTTLLNHMAKKILNIPAGIDILLCEQEIVADETKSIDSVLKADKVRTALLEEEKKLLVEVEKGNIKINERLKEVCGEFLIGSFRQRKNQSLVSQASPHHVKHCCILINFIHILQREITQFHIFPS
jgi:ATP-binding cassette subfamily F protein 1